MKIAYYFDVHVPTAITDGLRNMGVDVLTAQQDGNREMDDEDLLDRAMSVNRLMFTQDQDFLRIARDRQSEGIEFAGVIFARQVVVSIGQCIQDLKLIAEASELEEYSNRVLYLPL